MHGFLQTDLSVYSEVVFDVSVRVNGVLPARRSGDVAATGMTHHHCLCMAHLGYLGHGRSGHRSIYVGIPTRTYILM